MSGTSWRAWKYLCRYTVGPESCYYGVTCLDYYIPDDHVLNDPEFKRDDRYFLSNDEAFDASARKSVHIIQSIKEMDSRSEADRYYWRM